MRELKKLKEVKSLGKNLLSSRAHLNNLPLLLSYLAPDKPHSFILESLLSLHSFFATTAPNIVPVSSAKCDDNAQLIYNTWLRSKFEIFLSSLFRLVSSETEDMIKEMVLDSIMEFVKLGDKSKFQSSSFHKLILNLVFSEFSADSIMDSMASRYFDYIDVRYFTYMSVAKIAQNLGHGTTGGNFGVHDFVNTKERKEVIIRRVHLILSKIPVLDSPLDVASCNFWSAGLSDCDRGKLITDKSNAVAGAKYSKRFKAKFTKAWISFLRLPLPIDIYKEVLVNLHQTVIPHIANPKILCDFLTRSYNIGGVVSVMALSSIFIMITEHNLEYPEFYEKLYSLLSPSIFLAKHRAKFFELMDSCLKSPLLPAYLAAAFAKKLSRLSLSVPPSGALVIIALVHNLIRRHPSINCLIHLSDKTDGAESSMSEAKIVVESEETNEVGVDHFNEEENNPLKCNAMRSSLWEIDTLRNHYCPHVSRLVLSLENDLTVRSKTSEMAVADFSSASYATIFGNEMRRRVKQVPFAFYKTTPTSLFGDVDFGGWTFHPDDCERSTKRHRLN